MSFSSTGCRELRARTPEAAHHLVGYVVPINRRSKRIARDTASTSSKNLWRPPCCPPRSPETGLADLGLAPIPGLVNRLYGLDAAAFRFLMNTLFDTPRHRDTHFEYRDVILHRGW